jgi:hypothetical protein
MQTISLAFLLLVPTQSTQAIEQMETLDYIFKLQDKETGAFKVTPGGKPSLRACNGAVKGLKYLGFKKAIPNVEKVKTFVLSCYDPKTGAFAEPGGKPDVAITSIGVMVACELGIPKEKFAKSMEYLKENAKTFDEVRIAAAGVEAWGLMDCPFDLRPWLVIAQRHEAPKQSDIPNGHGREIGSAAALYLRLGKPFSAGNPTRETLPGTQWPDGGWGKTDVKKSDLESTYRVMRALMLLEAKPKDPTKLKEFLASCRNKDGGYGVTPGEKSSMSGVYYYAAISHWLDGMK